MQLRGRSLIQQTKHAAKLSQTQIARKRHASTAKTESKRKLRVKSEVEESIVKAEQIPDVHHGIGSMNVKMENFIKVEEPVVKLENRYEEKIENCVNEKGIMKDSKKLEKGKKPAPSNWKEIYSAIEVMRADKSAAVDTEGCETFNDEALEPPIRRFHLLVACMLSSQTKDPVTAAAMARLKTHGLTIDSMLEISQKDLAALLHPVSFFNNKAKYIQQTCLHDRVGEILKGGYNSDIPSTFDELIALPGVGPKMAHLAMSCAWNNTVGICVDVHVHRITNRLGWVNTWNKKGKSQDPEKTRKELEEWLPYEHWNDINVLLVGFGQQICLPVNPKCDECAINHLCPSAFKKSSP